MSRPKYPCRHQKVAVDIYVSCKAMPLTKKVFRDKNLTVWSRHIPEKGWKRDTNSQNPCSQCVSMLLSSCPSLEFALCLAFQLPCVAHVWCPIQESNQPQCILGILNGNLSSPKNDLPGLVLQLSILATQLRNFLSKIPGVQLDFKPPTSKYRCTVPARSMVHGAKMCQDFPRCAQMCQDVPRDRICTLSAASLFWGFRAASESTTTVDLKNPPWRHPSALQVPSLRWPGLRGLVRLDVMWLEIWMNLGMFRHWLLWLVSKTSGPAANRKWWTSPKQGWELEKHLKQVPESHGH